MENLSLERLAIYQLYKQMKKAKIYIPTKTAMQSGRGKLKKWVLEFVTKDSSINPLMGWESSTDTLGEVILKFSSKYNFSNIIHFAAQPGVIYSYKNPNIFL